MSPSAGFGATPSDSMGVYRGSANPGAVGSFGDWVGRRPRLAVDFLAKGSWSDISSPDWWADGWAGSGYDVVYSVPLLPDSGGTLQQGAQGAYNEHFRRLAQVLVARGQGDAILRLGWEMNGDWFRWSIKNGAADFAAYWRQVVTTMRAVSPAFRFDFTVNQGSSSVGGRLLDPAAAYPGDGYVDFIGMDVYDQGWGPNFRDPQARWQSNMEMPYGLRWHRDFAAARGKPMSFPEWALTTRDDGYGGGDAPYFIERMHDWIARNNVAYHAYFEFDAPDGRHELMNGQYPRAAARFRELFGGEGGGEPALPEAPGPEAPGPEAPEPEAPGPEAPGGSGSEGPGSPGGGRPPRSRDPAPRPRTRLQMSMSCMANRNRVSRGSRVVRRCGRLRVARRLRSDGSRAPRARPLRRR